MKTVLLVTLGLIILSAGCVEAKPTHTPVQNSNITSSNISQDTTPSTPTPTLENKTWVLKSYGQPENMKSVLSGTGFGWHATEITAFFDSATGWVTGSTHLNTHAAKYQLKHDSLSIVSTDGGGITDLGDPSSLANQDEGFIKLFWSADSYQIKNGELQINCGQQVLIFIEK